jgi:hypothetical protein
MCHQGRNELYMGLSNDGGQFDLILVLAIKMSLGKLSVPSHPWGAGRNIAPKAPI